MPEDFTKLFFSQKNVNMGAPPINENYHKLITNSEVLDIANQVISAIQPMSIRLTSEVQSLRKELQELKPERKKTKTLVMPSVPFKDIEPFLEFEKGLQEINEAFISLESELKLVAKAPNFVKNCWKKIITDELGERLCWKGTETKRSVRNFSTTKAIRNATLSLGYTEDTFIKDTRTFFQFAKNRIKLRNDYKNKKK
ncbi:uncharacterized protein LOC131806504 [Musca domestica]|uniref:Uncharacterized protein LOC131806504 n=1 Tax=Musca domestica TaxID=7370 RepID=A0ABM3VLE4_MUSDO|nr:uncharacterized protein LOC131806504 [Musca domestica]